MKTWEYLKFKTELEEHELKKQGIVNAEARVRQLRDRLAAIHSATTDSTPVSGGTNHREDVLVSNISERADLELSIRRAREDVEVVEFALNALSDNDRLILDRAYIHPCKGYKARLCEELGLKDERSARARQSEALRRYVIARCGQ